MTDAPAIKQGDNGIWMLSGEQLWDSDLLPIILEHIKEGDTVIDAGAWIGGHSMAYAKKVGVTGKVTAFEPNPDAYNVLILNVGKFKNVECFNFALGDTSRIVDFSVTKTWGDSGYVGDDHKMTEVRMVPLDDYHDLEPNFIKIDVEGCELKVLKGAEKTIEKHRPKMVIEINAPALFRQDNTAFQVWSWLEDRSYELNIIDKDATAGVTEIYNILCTPL